MKLLRTSVHYLSLPAGEKVKYLRLTYRTGRAVVGRSMLASRFPPEFVAKAEAAQMVAGESWCPSRVVR
jgi:hypothetical protein